MLDNGSSGTPTEVAVLRKVAAAGHPNICAFLEHYYKYGKHFIVMEACSGGELFQQVEAVGQITEEKARELGRGVVSGVLYMHKCGVAHRDLKLENLLLDKPNGSVKICDFGLAHVYEPLGDGTFNLVRLTRCCGTKSYTPPEVLAGMPYDGFLVDVWSLGVCLFAMCAGFFPLEVARSCDWRFQRLYVAQQEGRSTVHTIFGFYERACPFSADLVELLDGMLQINPRRRMTMREVASATWFLPMSMPKLNIDLATLGVSTSSMISSADSPISLGEIGACDPYGQISPNDVEYEADLAITAGDDANYVDPPPTSTYPLKASSTPVKERYEDSVKGGCRCPIDVDSSISAMCSR
mmetsp:Transcript_54854/g.117743  ORF Transcript_54854/g.117743 Transcript_54854/m.117743 type:complete len:353 (+) Transcript_54854:1-1059(+)